MVRRLVHVILVALALAAVSVAIASWSRAPLIWVAAAVWVAWYLGAAILLPRLAHGAFRAGETAKARRRYRVLGWLSPTARPAARVSIAGCHLIERRWDRAQESLLAIDGERLPGMLRAAWLNNRAYAIARGGHRDGGEALALVDEALALRPGVPGFLHTRGLALYAGGKVDEAIRAFDAVWESGEVEPALEAERCHDLALAWDQKGHRDYATDYRLRAVRAAPRSPWALDVAAGADLSALESQIS